MTPNPDELSSLAPAASSGHPELPLELRVDRAPEQIEMAPLVESKAGEVQPELPLCSLPAEPLPLPALSLDEQVLEFDRVQANIPKTEYSRRNRQILKMRAESDSIEKIARVTDFKIPTIKWVLKLARERKFDRLVQKGRAGRKGQRRLLLAELRKGTPPDEVARMFQRHRSTVWRALHQLQSYTAAA